MTPAEWGRLKTVALEKVKASLGVRGQEELRAVLGLAAGSVGVYLAGLVEQVLRRSLPTGVAAPAEVEAPALRTTVQALANP